VDETLPLSSRDDPLFAEGMAHLQSAEWQEAVRCFETLAAHAGDDPAVAAALGEARFKAKLDAGTHIRPRRWTFSWRPIIVRVLLVLSVAVLGLLILQLLSRQIAPAVAASQRARRIEALVKEGQSNLDAWKIIEAAKSFGRVQALDSGNAAAAAGLAAVEQRQTLLLECTEAETLFAAGDLVAARERYTDLAVAAPGYCNATNRIAETNDRLQREEVWKAAEEAYNAGDCANAIDLYKQIQTVDVSYQKSAIADHLYDCSMRLGRELIEANPPVPEQIPEALNHFTEALAARPRDTEASL
jgi:outer membrane protein assembly factor BamD (BamD/ComL family)